MRKWKLDYRLDDATLGGRLQAARKAVGLTQGEVGKTMGMATSTVSDIEAGKRSVTGIELHSFARLYHRPLATFLEEVTRESAGFQYLFRAPEIDILDRESIVEFHQLARDYALIEEVVEAAPLPVPPDYSQFGFKTDYDAETLAEMERGRLGLGNAPLGDVMNLLDSTIGVRTFFVPVERESWSGLVVRDEDGRPCIAVNAKEDPYRRNFALAHEYGHVLAHLAKLGMPEAHVDKALGIARSSADERFANAFAAAFLMPRRAVLAQLERVLGSQGGRFTDFDLTHMAMYFGVSGQAMTLRLVGLRKLPRQKHEEYWRNHGTFKELAKALGYEVEDWSLRVVLPTRFRYLAHKAYGEGRISLARLAEVLHQNYYQLRQTLETPASRAEGAAG